MQEHLRSGGGTFCSENGIRLPVYSVADGVEIHLTWYQGPWESGDEEIRGAWNQMTMDGSSP
jgi:hypothetical protein